MTTFDVVSFSVFLFASPAAKCSFLDWERLRDGITNWPSQSW